MNEPEHVQYEPTSVDLLTSHALEAVRTVAEDAMEKRLTSLGVRPGGIAWGDPRGPLSAERILVTVDALELCTLLEEAQERVAHLHDAMLLLARQVDTVTQMLGTTPESSDPQS